MSTGEVYYSGNSPGIAHPKTDMAPMPQHHFYLARPSNEGPEQIGNEKKQRNKKETRTHFTEMPSLWILHSLLLTGGYMLRCMSALFPGAAPLAAARLGLSMCCQRRVSCIPSISQLPSVPFLCQRLLLLVLAVSGSALSSSPLGSQAFAGQGLKSPVPGSLLQS